MDASDKGEHGRTRHYYTPKRIGHQWQQVQMLLGLPTRSVLEVGPALGLVTAILDNAGYQVTTLDVVPRGFERPDCPTFPRM